MPEDSHGAVTQIGPSFAPRLEVIQGENIGETYKVRLKTRLGRERDNDIVLLDPKISRYHAQISMEGGQWTLTDLGSSNRTYLNGIPITEPTALKSGDRIALGTSELVLTMPGETGVEALPLEKEAPLPVSDVSSTPPAAPPASPDVLTPQKTGQRIPPRITWIAAGFILLLCLVTAFILYMIGGRTPETNEGASSGPLPGVSEGEESPPVEVVEPPGELILVYEDDFSNSFGGWDDAFDTYTIKQYGNNRYQIEVTTSNLVAWGLANRDVADFEIEVEARMEDGSENNSYGILFRFQDRENFYRFDISGDGYFLLSQFLEGEWLTLVDWTESQYINTGLGVNNLLKVSAFGPNITVWVNGQPLASVTDDSLTHGNFGFFAGTFSEPYVWVSYDNLKMWVLEGEERAITLIPTATRSSVAPATATPTPSPTPTLIPPTNTPTSEPESTSTIVPEEELTPTVTQTPTSTPTATPTSEPTATPVPLPEYASRDQTLARGETRVTGRIVFPVFDPARGTYDIYIADAADGANRELAQSNASQPALSLDGTNFAYRSWQPDNRGLFARTLNSEEAWRFNPFFESAHPQFSPADNSLMFHSRVGGEEPAIYRVINGVSEVMRREGFPIQGEVAKWGPDGQQFVYSSCLGGKCGIIRSNIDGTNPVLLSDHPTDTKPEISPDGSTVVFMSRRGGDWEIYRVGIDGGTITALTSDDANDGLPTWSPDGDKIAFVANRDGEWAMWDMDPDGSNQRRLFDLGGSIDGIVQHDISNSFGWIEENIDWIP